jgi:fibronectin-binding autotransporter adhesin
MFCRNSVISAFALAVVLGMGIVPQAHAAEQDWAISGSGNWNTASNWVSGNVPANGDTPVTITTGGTVAISTAGTYGSFNEIWIGNNGGAGNFTMTAGTLDIANWFEVGRLYGSTVTNSSTSTATISGVGTLVTTSTSGSGHNAEIGWNDVSGGRTTGIVNVINGAKFTTNASPIVLGTNYNGNNSAIALGIFNLGANSTDTATAATALLDVGTNYSNAGVFNINSGTVTVTSGDSRVGGAGGTGDFAAYGILNLSTGTLTSLGNFQVGAYGVGVMNQTSGVWTSNGGYPDVGRFTSGNGVYNISGGVFNNLQNALIVGEQGTGVLNVTGTAQMNLGALGLYIGWNAGTGVVNLSGGTLSTIIVRENNSNTVVSNNFLNFNGGTLRSTSATTTFLQGLGALAVNSGGAYVWNGGGTINNGGNAITIAQSLLAPTGQGVSSIALTGSGSGYYGEPMVSITGGGGAGATARAIMSGGQITSIVITNPGTGYTSSPTVTLLGGDPTTAASIGAVNVTANSSSGGMTFNGAGVTTLSGTNTYTGGTAITGGLLLFSTSAAQPTTGAITITNPGALAASPYVGGSGPITGWLNSGFITPNPTGALALLTGTVDTETITLSGTSSQLSLGSAGNATFSGALVPSGTTTYLGGGTGTLTFTPALTGGNGLTVGNGGGGTVILTASNSYTGPTAINAGTLQLSYSGATTYSGAISGAGGLTVTAGTVSLPAANSFTGNTTIAAATLNLSGGLANGTAAVNVGSVPGNSVLNISSNLSTGSFSIASSAGAVGAVYQTGGAVTASAGASTNAFRLGSGGYGYYNLSGGSLQMNELGLASANGGSGLLDMSGGTLTDASTGYFTMARGGPGQTGVLNISGGLLNLPGVGIQNNWAASDVSIINVSGTAVIKDTGAGNSVNLNNSGGATSTGILNLNGGTVQANAIITSNAGVLTLVNFNGGTLLANANSTSASTSFITGLTGAYIYGGGATINDNGFAIAVSQALLAPSGSGVTSIATSAGGSGYIAPPIVAISGGGGTGATAIATINRTTGQVTGITITNPGTGYTSAPAVTLSGGGGSGAGVGTAALATNATSGGLTKLGGGTLTLSAASNYAGGTLVGAGYITPTVNSAFGTGPVTVANGAQFLASAGALTIPNALSLNGTGPNGIGSIHLTGAASLTLGGSVSLAGSTIIKGDGSTALAMNNNILLNGNTLTFQQDGANTVNVSGNISDGTGPGSIQFLSTSTLLLSGSNSYSGGTTLNGNGLTIGSPNALGNGGLTVNQGTVNLNGFGVSVASLAGSGGLITDNTTGAAPTTLTVNQAGTTTFGGTISDGAGRFLALAKSGSGSLLLTANNAYSGPTTVSGGTLSLASSSSNNIPNSSSINLVGGSTLNASGLSLGTLVLGPAQGLGGVGTINGSVTSGSASAITPGSLTSIGALNVAGSLNMAAGGNLSFVLGRPGSSPTVPGLSSLINLGGSLTLPTSPMGFSLLNNNNSNGQGALGNGYYDVFNYFGTLNVSPSTAFGTGSGAKSYSFTIQGSNPSQLILQISIESLTWTGQVGGTGAASSSWDTMTTNWSNNANNTAINYADGAIVTFGDTNLVTNSAITNPNVTLNSVFAPTSITFSNSAVNYTVSGSGSITGATGITMNGTGVVSLQTSNSFTSPVAINAGAINISNPAALGNSSGAVVAGGAALQIQGGIVARSVPLTLNGSGLASSPAGALSNVSGNNTYSGAITLGSPATIAAAAGTLTLSGGVATGGNLLTLGGAGIVNVSTQPISGGGGLTVASPGTAVLSVANNYGGPTTVNSGAILQLGAASAIPTGAATGNVTVNGTLDLDNFNSTINGLFGNGTVGNESGGNAVTLSVGNNNASSTFAGVLSDGNGTLIVNKIGTGSLALTGPNNYSGTTTISGGTLQIGIGGSTGKLSSASPTSVGPAGTLAFDRGDANYVYNAANISNSGTVTSISSGTVTMNNAFNNSGTITSNGSGAFILNGGITNSGVVTSNGSGSMIIKGNIANSNLVTSNASGYMLISGNVSGGTLGNYGSGTLELAGSNGVTNFVARSGTTNIDGGAAVNTSSFASIGYLSGDYATVNLSGQLIAANNLNIGDGLGSTGILNVGPGAVVNAATLYVGRTGTAAGALTISGGTVQCTVAGNDPRIGGAGSAADSSAYGAFTITSGIFNGANNFQIGAYGMGVANQSGGLVTTVFYPDVGRFVGGNGVYSISGGTLQQLGPGGDFIIGEQGTGVLNVGGTGLVTIASNLGMSWTATGTSQVNLGGGTLSSAGVVVNNSAGSSIFNFNGGVLQGNASGSLMSGLNAAYVYSGGAHIDTTAGITAVLSQSLLAPSGSGLNVAGGTIAVTSGGSSYIGAPIVSLSGPGGSGATAIANLNGSGQVASITVTNPGSGYTGPLTATFSGGLPANGLGTAATPPVLPPVTADVSAGLTKTGSGTLVMTAPSTYNGPTLIQGGILQLGGILHRWSFNNGSLADSVGGSTATIQQDNGSNYFSSTSSVTLPGGTGGGAHSNPYISLGTNLLPTTGAATIEVWATQNQVQNWSRIFDFGSSNTNYVMMSWTQANNLTQDQVDFNTATANTLVNNSVAPYNLGQEYHIAMTFAPAGANTLVNWYVTPANAGSLSLGKSGSFTTANTIALLTQTNMWLGESQFTGDSTSAASYDEVRIWDSALPVSYLNIEQAAGPDAVSYGNILPSTQPVIISGGGQLNVSGWAQTISSLSSSDSSTSVALGNGNLTTGGDNSNTTFAGVISGAGGGLTKVGTGTFTLTASNTFTGNTIISAGVLYLANSQALGGSTLDYDNQGGTLSLGTLTSVALGGLSGGENLPLVNLAGASVPLTVGSNGTNTTYTGVLTEGAAPGASLTKVGKSILTLANSNAYTGGTTVAAGGLAITTNNSLGTGAVTVNAGGRIEMSNNITVSGQTLTISGNGSSADGSLYGALRSTSGTNTWAGNVILSDANTRVSAYASSALILSGSITSAAPGDGLIVRSPENANGVVIVTGVGAYRGPTDVITGTLQNGGNNVFAASWPLVMGNNSTGPLNVYDLAGWNQSFAGLQDGAAPVNTYGLITNSGAGLSTLTVSQTGASTFSGVIQGSIALLNTAGTQTLLGANTYSGPTTVSGGELSAGTAGVLSITSPVTVTAGGVLDVSAAPQSIASLAIGSSASLNLNMNNLLSSNGSAGFANGSTLNLSGVIPSLPQSLIYALSISGSFTNVDYYGIPLPSGDLSYGSNYVQLTNFPMLPPSWISGSGTWSLGSNWSSNSAPNNVGATALLDLNTVPGLAAITLDVPVTLGTLQFGSTTTSYALSGNTLTLDNNAGAAAVVTVQSGTHSISSAVFITGGNLDISASGNSILSIPGAISDDGGLRSLNLAGDGTGELVLSGNNTYGGGTYVNAGRLVVASPNSLPAGSNLYVGAAASSFSPVVAGPALSSGELVAVPEPGSGMLLFAALWSAAFYYRRR